MLILSFKSGNHSNRLFQNLHFEAFCKENNIDYINPSFENMHGYYKNPCKLQNSNNFSFANQIKSLNFLYQVNKKFNLFPNIISFNFKNKTDTKVLLKAKISNIYTGGWHFRNLNLTEKYQTHYINNYSLKEEYYSEIEMLNTINYKKNDGYVVIGVHIRRGDYNTYLNGQFYFEDHVYLNKINQIQSELKKHRKETFVILFSNENITIKENENIVLSKNEWFVDHHLMSCCNYLIGPPSTFTLWASYIGNVPYYHIKSKEDKISLAKFDYCRG